MVGIFAGHELEHRGVHVGIFRCAGHLGTLIVREFLLCAEELGYVDISGRLVEQGARTVEFGLHAAQHGIDGGEGSYRYTELFALVGIAYSLTQRGLHDPDRLRAYIEACTVHHRHDILYEAQTARSEQFGRSVVECQLARGRSLYSHLVLDAAYRHAAPFAVIDKARETACIRRAAFGACQHQFYVGVTVCDETLDTVEQPHAALLAPRGLQHGRLQVAAGVGFGEIHRAGLAARNAGDKLGLELLVAEFAYDVHTSLQRPYIAESGIGARHHLRGHDEHYGREVQPVVASRLRQSVEARSGQHIVVALRSRGVCHAATLAVGPLGVDVEGVGGNGAGAYLAHDLHNLVVRVDGVVEVLGSRTVFAALRVTILLERDDALHHRVRHLTLETVVVLIEIVHSYPS